VLTLLDRLCRDDGLALLLISHDIGVVSSLVDRVIVMLAGKIVEEAPINDFLDAPLHPYSQSLGNTTDQARPAGTHTMAGARAQLGCAFAGQCPLCTPECEKNLPELTTLESGRALRCPIVAAEVDP
jgi:oligopeptide/dipeptide ABC transporter ATP-binding protein